RASRSFSRVAFKSWHKSLARSLARTRSGSSGSYSSPASIFSHSVRIGPPAADRPRVVRPDIIVGRRPGQAACPWFRPGITQSPGDRRRREEATLVVEPTAAVHPAAVVVAEDAAEGLEQPRAEVGGQRGFAVCGAEDE